MSAFVLSILVRVIAGVVTALLLTVVMKRITISPISGPVAAAC